MKRQMITMMTVATVFVVLSVSSARAQDAGTMTVNIPFNFAISGATLPAGEYYVRRTIEGAHVLIQVRGNDNSRTVYLPIHPVTGGDMQTASKLVFRKYGGQYFLSQVWIAGRRDGEELRKTSSERMLQREIAKRKTNAETIAIAAKLN